MTSPDDLLRELAELATSLGPAVRPVGTDELLRALTETARQLFGAAACSLALLSEDDSELLYTVAAGEGAEDVTGMRIPASQGIAGWVVQSGQPIAISDVASDPRFAREAAEQTGYVPQAILAVPVETPQQTLGVISLLDRDPERPGAEHDMALLSLFADQAALALASVETLQPPGAGLAGRAGGSSGRPRPGPRAAAGRQRIAVRRPRAGQPGRYLLGPRPPRRRRAPAGPGRAARCRGVHGEAAVTSSLRPAWSDAFAQDALRQVARIDLPVDKAWAWDGASGAGVTVAVVDSGVDAAHPAVGSVERAVALRWDNETEDVTVTEGPHEDLFGHGTACAGIIRRAAPDAAIWSVRVLGSRLTGKGVVFAAGLRWAIAAGARVLNLSLSTGRADYYGLFHEIADEAAFAGVILVCAANNVPAPTYPAQFSSVISVAAHDGQDPFGLDANPAPPTDFGAPGIDVRVPWLSGSTIVSTGNSFAAPHVTGLVARLLSKHPDLTPYEVKTVLRAVASNAVILASRR